jgi:hypothetical protein
MDLAELERAARGAVGEAAVARLQLSGWRAVALRKRRAGYAQALVPGEVEIGADVGA